MLDGVRLPREPLAPPPRRADRVEEIQGDGAKKRVVFGAHGLQAAISLPAGPGPLEVGPARTQTLMPD